MLQVFLLLKSMIFPLMVYERFFFCWGGLVVLYAVKNLTFDTSPRGELDIKNHIAVLEAWPIACVRAKYIACGKSRSIACVRAGTIA